MKTLLFAALIFLASCGKDDSPVIDDTIKPSIEVLSVVKFPTKTRFDIKVTHPELVRTIFFYWSTGVNVPPKSSSFFVDATGTNPGKFTIETKQSKKIIIEGVW